ncbi:MAG: type IV pilus twitching motility protein PilT [Candidatus Gottesmanbacteria bacterium]
MNMQELFAEAARISASDIHILVGYSPMLRVSGKLQMISGQSVLTESAVNDLLFSICSSEQKELFLTNKEVDFSFVAATGRFRVNLYHQRGSTAGAFRYIPDKIRSIEDLGLPEVLHSFVKLRQGLILVTGPTGQGKSTTLAAMIDRINQTKASHIVTIEDPVEYIYPPAMSIVSQREMHGDTHSWSIALRSVLREDPDIVLIGEMRDYETIAAAITIAETGHLVLATLHTNSAAQTIDRIIDVFPEHQQAQVRLQLSNTLEGVISQRLVPAIKGGLVAVCEVMTATPAVRSVIRDGKTHQLDNIIQTSAEFSMITLEASLAKAVNDGKISVDVATAYALRPEDIGKLLKRA